MHKPSPISTGIYQYAQKAKRLITICPEMPQKGISRHGSVSACLAPKGKSYRRRVIASAEKQKSHKDKRDLDSGRGAGQKACCCFQLAPFCFAWSRAIILIVLVDTRKRQSMDASC